MELFKIYHPITAVPFKCTEEYMEIEPCDALKPYVRCFWGSRKAVKQDGSGAGTIDIVIPDTCMDIIFKVDFINNKIESCFCGIDDRSFATYNDRKKSITFFTFAIRFYPWGVPMFAEESMRNTKNAFFDAGYHFSKIKEEIEKCLFDVTDIYQLIVVVEKILLNHFKDRHINHVVFQAVSKILESRGNLRITNLRQDVFASSRQLERLFLEYVGVSPKSLASMVRYQYLWNEFIYHPNFNILDAVCRYGYSDQAHLCHDIKKYHTMSMSEAREYAVQHLDQKNN